MAWLSGGDDQSFGSMNAVPLGVQAMEDPLSAAMDVIPMGCPPMMRVLSDDGVFPQPVRGAEPRRSEGMVTAFSASSQVTWPDILKELRSLQEKHEERIGKLLDSQEHRVVSALVRDIKNERPRRPEKSRDTTTSRPTVGRQTTTRQTVKTAKSIAPTSSVDVIQEHTLAAESEEADKVQVLPKSTNQIVALATPITPAPASRAKTAEAQDEKDGQENRRKALKLSQYFKDMEELQEGIGKKRLERREGENIKWCSGMAERIVHSRVFDYLVCLAIIFNSATIGISADREMRFPTHQPLDGLRIIDISFIIFFSFEITLRLVAEGISFFSVARNPNWNWNYFDFSLVLTSVSEEVLSSSVEWSDVSAVRLFRTLRLVRVFRIIRVMRFFKDLRAMVSGIRNSFQSLFWALLLLVFMMYLFAVCVLQFASEEATLKQLDPASSSLEDEVFEKLIKYYGSLAITMYTLYGSITNGLGWMEAARPLMILHPALGFLFLFYIAFAILCVLNIITGVFVENATRIAAEDEEMVMMEELDSRKQWYTEIKDLFEAADVDGSGQLSAAEFSAQMQDMKMQAWFRKVGIHVESYNAEGLFGLLDFDGDGVLDLDEFALAIHQVHGHARSIDVAGLKHDTRILRREVADLVDICQFMVEALHSRNSSVGEAPSKRAWNESVLSG